MTKWHIGDFGRFIIENRQFPRFELVGLDKAKRQVQVWYSGQSKPSNIPLATFKEDCANWWDITTIDLTMPPWLVSERHFMLDTRERAINVTVTQIKDTHSSTTQAIDVKGQTFTFRRRKGDYVSCFCESLGILLLIPAITVKMYAKPYTTRWDMLRNRDILDPEDELLY